MIVWSHEIKQALINEEQKRKPGITCTSNYNFDRALYVKAERGCFVYGGRRHYKAECPNNKKREVASAAHICSNCTSTTDIDDADCEEEPGF